LAAGKSREEVEAIAREDHFCANGLAEFRVIEFRVSQRADDLAASLASLRAARAPSEHLDLGPVLQLNCGRALPVPRP
jgi:hypothetical protein